MNYNQAKEKYWKKKMENPFPPLPEDERIYLNVPYMARDFAKYSHCGFDPERKLWFTGAHNWNLYSLVNLYGVNKATSEKAMGLMKAKLAEIDEVITSSKLLRNKRFVLFCSLEYGIELDELLNTSCDYLYKLMKEWYECPEILYGPCGITRQGVEKAIDDGKIKETRHSKA